MLSLKTSFIRLPTIYKGGREKGIAYRTKYTHSQTHTFTHTITYNTCKVSRYHRHVLDWVRKGN